MKLTALFKLLFPALLLSSCFENEQGLYVCEAVFEVVEKMPRLDGGVSQIQEQVVYPEEAKKRNIEGRVIVDFVVNKIGRTVNLQVREDLGFGTSKEAMRVVRASTWEPAYESGEPVCVNFALSINFRLDH
ncbi:MAG: TonB family protein [Balneolaceae bacterium]